MPPKFKFTKEEIISAALDLTRENGIAAITARGLASRLGSSAKPIFGLFQNMEEVQKEVLLAADTLYESYIQTDMAGGKYPPYKASGMAYIRFAKEEQELFKLLFMRDRSMEEKGSEKSIDEFTSLIEKNIGISKEEAVLFHLEMWFYVHGIATMIATGYLDWDTEFVSDILSDAYQGLKNRFLERKEKDGSN